MNPQRVVSIHCGVHPEEREKRKGWPMLLDNLRLLVDAGFPVIASSVMAPPAFALYERAAERLDSVGVPLIPKLLRGAYRGKAIRTIIPLPSGNSSSVFQTSPRRRWSAAMPRPCGTIPR